ncbi:thymidylate synthase [Methanocalculus chunghsingensis]|uniref:Putative thymidylate synthase n=1 Tax=Methanocalculus chunghsingensis TaxID=156457 RepID=A0A8J7WAT6_9EURY|nr:thymidylate synthase [Methanocalculus chunghsingensis]MBR1369292.1 thymidylate synthase [Methanocalculus chunghsingensis]
MKIIRAATLARGHELVVAHILEKGRGRRTENGEETLETDEVTIRVEDPLALPMASAASRFRQAFLDCYAEDLISGSDSVFEYDYHSRLFDWGQGNVVEGVAVHADQIAYIVRKLTEEPATRRAVAVTWNPPVDEELDDCPCLQLIQCVQRDGLLDMKVVFRSNDMLSAAGANMYALARLQEHIAGRAGLPVGAYTHISLVPHIYYRRDIADIPPFCGEGKLIRPQAEVCKACRGCGRAEQV